MSSALLTSALAFVAVFGKREDARALAKLLSGHLVNTFGELALHEDLDVGSFLFIPWGICILIMDTADENVGELYVHNAVAEGVAPVGVALVALGDYREVRFRTLPKLRDTGTVQTRIGKASKGA